MHHLLRALLLALLLTITLRLSSIPTPNPSRQHHIHIHIHNHSIPISPPSHHPESLTVTCTPLFSNGRAICAAVIGQYNHEVADGSPGLMYKTCTYYVEAEWVKEWVLLAVRWGIVLDLVRGLQFWG